MRVHRLYIILYRLNDKSLLDLTINSPITVECVAYCIHSISSIYLKNKLYLCVALPNVTMTSYHQLFMSRVVVLLLWLQLDAVKIMYICL